MQTELDLRDYLRIIRKRLWLIIVIVAVVTAGTGFFTYMVMQPIYQASTKLIVNKGNEPFGVSQLDLNTVNLNIRLIETYKEIIKTPAIMDIVAEEHPEFRLTSEQLTGKIRVNSVNNTQVMTLMVTDPSHNKAVDIVNAVSAVFIRVIPTLMNVDNVSLLSAAAYASNPAPVKPDPLLNMAVGFILSFIAAVGIVLLYEYLDDSFKTESDVHRYLGLPTLAMIPKVQDEDLVSLRQSSTIRNVKSGEVHNVSAQ